MAPMVRQSCGFQSPLGEVVKETLVTQSGNKIFHNGVSIPSRGSGKGDLARCFTGWGSDSTFQSPLGEVVKET
jgi:hypothetical protein